MRTVVVLPYDPRWALEFAHLRRALEPVLDGLALGIEHVGSTSVPGLDAKPILDIDVVMRGYEGFPAIERALRGLGYRHEGDGGIPERERFRYEGRESRMAHHLYVCPVGSAELARHLRLRDRLRQSGHDRAAYAEIKREMALRHPHDIDAYIAGKGPVIAEILARCENPG